MAGGKRRHTSRKHSRSKRLVAKAGALFGPDGLPNELLHRILHTCGRHTRRVCRHWHDVFGPLTGGLLLSSPQDVARIPPHLAVIPTVALTPTDPAVVAALPHAFTHLQSLDLDATLLRMQDRPFEVPIPTSLHTLTSLALRHLRPPLLRILAASLPALRSLTLVDDSPPCQLAGLKVLSSLSHLRQLSLPCRGYPGCANLLWEPVLNLAAPPDALAALAALPTTLTHLDLSAFHVTPGPDGFSCLLPSLRYLYLNLAFDERPAHNHADSGMEALASVLSQRQALTHLELALTVPYGDAPRGFDSISRLHNLRSLHLCFDWRASDAQQQTAEVSCAVAALPALQRLVLHPMLWQNQESTLQSLFAPATLTELRASCCLPAWATYASLESLTLLQHLDLDAVADFYCYGDPEGAKSAADAILVLTQLTWLRLLSHDHRGVVHAVLAGVSALASLQQLQISPDARTDFPSQLAAAGSSLTRLELPCHYYFRSTALLRSLRRLPYSFRCLVLIRIKVRSAVNVQTVTRFAVRREEEFSRALLQELLPLPGGLRALVLQPDQQHELPGSLRSGLEATARAQDCVVVSRLPEDERHFGCNGYRVGGQG